MLRKIHLRYDQKEDRLLLSLEAEARTHHLLITRRFWGRARQALQQLLDLSADVPQHLPAAQRSSLSAANHQATAALTPTAHEEVKGVGIPADAVLVTGLRLGRQKPRQPATVAERGWVLHFELAAHAGLRLVVNDKTLHALVSGLLQREEMTQWALPPLPARAMPAPHDSFRLQ